MQPNHFYFLAPARVQVQGTQPAAVELAYWQSAERCGTAACLEEYLKKYPHGEFTSLAQVRLAALERRPLSVGRYRDQGNGTVIDPQTRLMWKRCSEGQTWTGSSCAGELTEMTWDAAMPGGKQRAWPSFAGYDDWRMPTQTELGTLVWCSNGTPQEEARVHSCSGQDNRNGTAYQRPIIDTAAFPNAPSSWYWSASLRAAPSFSDAWGLDFESGTGDWYDRSHTKGVRLVRTGQ